MRKMESTMLMQSVDRKDEMDELQALVMKKTESLDTQLIELRALE
jgi:hypothetical protein